jgi:alpha-glucosidase
VRPDNPYAMQKHLHDKSQPENLDFLVELRQVLDAFGAASVGEVGDENAPPLMAEYTAAGRRLHMAYSFAMLTADGSAKRIRHECSLLDAALARTGGWGCWAFSNHDVVRVATRWAPAGTSASPAQVTMMQALLLSLRGSVSMYQGEELGLPEADVPFELLQDPYGKAFWPEFKGRDGCRTPMPWTAAAPHAGFSSAQPWLPLGTGHAERAVDVQEADPTSALHSARRLLAWRRSQPLLVRGEQRFFDAPEPVLLFERFDAAGHRLLVAVNLGAEPVQITLPPSWYGAQLCTDAPLQGGAVGAAHSLSLHAHGVVFAKAGA